MENIVQIENISREYKVAKRDGGFAKFIFSREHEIVYAVRNISFSVAKGELVGLLGPNGSGKSTTIKMLSGIITPSAGKLYVMGNDPFKRRKHNAYNIGVVFGQRSQLWWDLPIGDTFYLLKKIYKISDETYKQNLNLSKKYLDLESIWNQPVRQLSLGQRMRAEIVAAILHNPKLLFLDEPTIGLDIVVKHQIREFILKLNNDYKTTVILTSHDMKDIEDICKKIILVDKGRVAIDCHIDELKQMYNKTAVVKLSLSSAVSNIAILGARGMSELGGRQWSFLVDKSVTTTGRVVFEVSQIAEVTELEIIEQAMEDILHDIYKNGVR
ncbi:MAG: ATP-binding cassette domain-containing protein [Ruminiclostridium sp.]|nr:ATP-binding cassette domain-containing protein [Ruminiclostridium sp.]